MPNPEDQKLNEQKHPEACNCKAARNTFLFSLIAVATGAAIYYAVKKIERNKMERELLDYEVWG